MSKLSIEPSTTSAQLKASFNELFGGVLHVYKGNSQLSPHAVLTAEGAKVGTIEVYPSMTVADFVAACQNELNLRIKVYTKDEWVIVLPEFQLGQVGKIPRGATRKSMAELLEQLANGSKRSLLQQIIDFIVNLLKKAFDALKHTKQGAKLDATITSLKEIKEDPVGSVMNAGKKLTDKAFGKSKEEEKADEDNLLEDETTPYHFYGNDDEEEEEEIEEGEEEEEEDDDLEEDEVEEDDDDLEEEEEDDDDNNEEEELTEEDIIMIEELQKDIASLRAEIQSLCEALRQAQNGLGNVSTAAVATQATKTAAAKPQKSRRPVDPNNLDYMEGINDGDFDYAYRVLREAQKQTADEITSVDLSGEDVYESDLDEHYIKLFEAWCPPVFAEKNTGEIEQLTQKLLGIGTGLSGYSSIAWRVLEFAIQYQLDKATCLRIVNGAASAKTSEMLFKAFYSENAQSTFASGDEKQIMSLLLTINNEIGLSIEALADMAILFDAEKAAGYILNQYRGDNKSQVAQKIYAKFPNLKK